MYEYICKCIKGKYKGLEFRFRANDIGSNSIGYHLFFKDLRQVSDFIIKFFLNAYEENSIEMNLDGTYCVICSPSIEIERAVI